MGCNRCPHHVRHGQFSKKTKSIEYSDLCGLLIKQSQEPQALVKKNRRGRPAVEITKRRVLPKGTPLTCVNHPFPERFDYILCSVYQETFASTGLRNGVIPTKDFQFSESLSGTSVTDMEFL